MCCKDKCCKKCCSCVCDCRKEVRIQLCGTSSNREIKNQVRIVESEDIVCKNSIQQDGRDFARWLRENTTAYFMSGLREYIRNNPWQNKSI